MKIGVRRAEEIGTVVRNAIAAGYNAALVTLTERHHLGQGLELLWDAQSTAWGSVTSGKSWVRDQLLYDLQGWIRIVEPTYGDHGWHVHVHALVIGKFDQEQVNDLGASMFGRWSRALQRAGLDAPLPVGQKFQLISSSDEFASTRVSEYLTKGSDGVIGIGAEMTISQGKTARTQHATRPPMELLDEFFETGDIAMRNLWHEFERRSKGKRQISWSKGLRERFGAPPEQTDEEIAAEEIGTEADTLVFISRAGWKKAIKVPDLPCMMLEAAETGGQDAVCRLLDRHGIEYRLPDWRTDRE